MSEPVNVRTNPVDCWEKEDGVESRCISYNQPFHPKIRDHKNMERIAAHEKTDRDGLEEGMGLILPE